MTGYPGKSTAALDGYVNDGATATNNGGSTEMPVRSSSGIDRRGFIRFDLAACSPAIPSAATVKVATLRMYMFDAPAATRTYDVSKVTTPCPEGLSTCWGETTLRWNNQPGVAATPTASVSACSTCVNVYLSWTVTADVQSFVSGASSNYGWRIGDSVENGATTQLGRFRTTERNDALTAPHLVVTYIP